MSTIIVCPKEGVLLADRFVLEASDIRKGFIGSSVKLEDKIKTTPDKLFAYVFEETQYPELVPVILSYIQRYEAGVLPADEPAPKFKETDLKDGNFALAIMTKRHFYRYCSNGETNLAIRDIFWSNHFTKLNWCASVDLPARRIFKIILEDAPSYTSPTPQIVEQKSLKLIPVTRPKKGKAK